MYVTDILPTLAAAANFTIDREIDGLSQWKTIAEDSPSPRQEILYNIENSVGYSAIVHEGWKLLNGTENINNAGWLGDVGLSKVNASFESYFDDVLKAEASKGLPQLKFEDVRVLRSEATVKCDENKFAVKCNPLQKPCLFNIIEDPCEQNNLANSHPLKVEFLVSKLNKHFEKIVPSMRRPSDPNCDPGRFNNTWTWWQDIEANEKSQDYLPFVYTLMLCCILFAFSLTLFLKYKSQSNKSKFLT